MSVNPTDKWSCFCLCITVSAYSKCVHVCAYVCVSEFARQAASSMPVGGGVSSPDTGCLYCSVYYWHCATQLSSDLWIGMVCICTQMVVWCQRRGTVCECLNVYLLHVCVHACVKKKQIVCVCRKCVSLEQL